MAFPFAEDNAALFWLSTRVMGTDIDLVHSQASPFYLAWLFQPTVLFRESQVIGNTAAVFKIVGAAFLLLSCFSFAHRHFSKWGGLLALLIFVMVLNSFIGDYGFFKSGKETPMGMVLLLAFFSLLIGIGGKESRDSWSGWLLLGVLANLAVGFAAVSIPYLAVVYGFLLLLGRPGVKALAALLVTGFAVLPISFALMLDKSLVACFLIHAVVCSVFYFLSRSRVLEKSVGRLFSSVARNSQLFVLFLGVSSVLSLWLLLPVRYESLPYYPIDGETSLAKLVVDLPWMGGRLPLISLLGILLMGVESVIRRNPGLAIFVVFPWISLFVVVAIASFQISSLPFPPQHLWDLAKDIPNWWLPTYFGVGVAWLVFKVGTTGWRWAIAFLKRWQNGYTRVPGSKPITISHVLTVFLIAGLIVDRAQTPWFWAKEWTGDLYRVGAAVHSEKDVATAADFLHGYFLILPKGDGRFVFAGDTAENQLWTDSKKDRTHSLNGVGGGIQKFDPGKGTPSYISELPLGFALSLVDRETFGSIPSELNPTALLELNDHSIFCIIGDKDAYGEIVDRIKSNQP